MAISTFASAKRATSPGRAYFRARQDRIDPAVPLSRLRVSRTYFHRDVASFNRILFAQSHETGIAKRFHERLEEIIGEFTDGARAVPLPPWNQSAESVEMPEFPVLQACS